MLLPGDSSLGEVAAAGSPRGALAARGTNPTSGRRGLGELVRAGVVMPVSHVS